MPSENHSCLQAQEKGVLELAALMEKKLKPLNWVYGLIAGLVVASATAAAAWTTTQNRIESLNEHGSASFRIYEDEQGDTLRNLDRTLIKLESRLEDMQAYDQQLDERIDRLEGRL